jgi:uncharacterized membrane protein
MLQLNVSSTANSSAVYPDVTASLGTTEVLLEFTQSYDYSKTDNVIATLINTVSLTNPWLVFQVSGSTLPTASGQYDVKIHQFTGEPELLTWATQNTLWNVTAQTWDSSNDFVKTQLLSTERAFISGSNGVSTTTYLSPTNGGTYTTYNYP